MYDTVKSVIDGGKYNLADLLHRIDVLYASAQLSDDERAQLVEYAQEHENPDAQLPAALDRIGALEMRCAEIEKRLDEIAPIETGEDTSTTTDVEWPAYRVPTSKDEYYNKGDKITFTDGKHYVCVKNNVVNGPDVAPKQWELVEDNTASEQPAAEQVSADGAE